MNHAQTIFQRGRHAVWRSRSPKSVGYVIPVTVAHDDGDTIALFQHHGSVCKQRTGKRAWSFSADWSAWASDPAWPVPQLPENWSQIW